ncbi:MAG: PP2C family serine/threonine-protein phosphatase [Desulfatirhabdiaceae bacterium]
MTYAFATLSEKGGRHTNQDYSGSLILNGMGCWAIADGLGGHRGGEIASRLAVEQIIDSFARFPGDSPMALMTHLQSAQNAIISWQEKDRSVHAMCTTILVLITGPGKAIWAHIGDSRLYHFRNGHIRFQTKDHSVPQILVETGHIHTKDIRFHEDRNRLVRVLGKADSFRPVIEQSPHYIQPGDSFLLCTDGFWEHVMEFEMSADRIESASPEEWLHRMKDRILKRAGNYHDNYSAVAIFVTGRR